MTKKLNTPTTPGSGERKQKDIQQKTGPVILIVLTTDQQDESKEKEGEITLLNEKLDLLHNCLVPSGIPKKIPAKLSVYSEAFRLFRQEVKDCVNGQEQKYIDALRIFRDVLLGK